MKQITIVTTSILLVLWSLIPISNTLSNLKANEVSIFSHRAGLYTEGEVVFNQSCKVCHGMPTESPGARLAPPVMMVKQHYTAAFPVETEFVEQISKWLDAPAKDNSLMPGAVARFGVMPPLQISEEDQQSVAKYIFETSFDGPTCDEKNCQKNGKGHSGVCDHHGEM